MDIMNQGKNKLIAARLSRVVPDQRWWSVALRAVSGRRGHDYHATLERLAQRETTDRVSEDDVKAWLEVFDTVPVATSDSRAEPQK
jgi:hypothetical protein